MPPHDPSVRRARGRPRSADAEQRIFDAAIEEYGQRGWSGFTMDAVARRAGVGKSTVYLRWQDKDALLTDAVEATSSVIEAVDTGTLRGDLEALATNLFRYLLDPVGWAALRITVDSAGAPEPLGQFTDAVTEHHRNATMKIVTRAVDRGDATSSFPAETLFECLYGAVVMHTLTLSGDSRKVDEAEIAERVRALVAFLLPVPD